METTHRFIFIQKHNVLDCLNFILIQYNIFTKLFSVLCDVTTRHFCTVVNTMKCTRDYSTRTMGCLRNSAFKVYPYSLKLIQDHTDCA